MVRATAPETSFYRHFTYQCPFGMLTFEQRGNAITSIVFGKATLRGPKQATALTNAVSTQFMEYFAGKRQTFDFPMAPEGTEFQKEVWAAVRAIPYGETRCAQDIARELGKESSYRSVGAAINKCPIAIAIPTHRIVAAPGRKLNATKQNVLNAALLKEEERHLE